MSCFPLTLKNCLMYQYLRACIEKGTGESACASNVSGVEIYHKTREKGFELAKGYGILKNTTFRIGNMGHIEFEEIESMLEALEEVLAGVR